MKVKEDPEGIVLDVALGDGVRRGILGVMIFECDVIFYSLKARCRIRTWMTLHSHGFGSFAYLETMAGDLEANGQMRSS